MASADGSLWQSSATGKRKLDPIKDPNEIYKSAKHNTGGTDRHLQTQPADETENGQEHDPMHGDDEDFGPEMPPDDDEDRFFGGGLSKEESQIIDFVDDADDGRNVDKIDAGWLRKTALHFEKRISKNAELRSKFESEPQKFIGSEADLDADIKSLSVLAEHPELYPEFVRLGCVDSLIGLLAHENTDIAIDTIEIISELTDEDIGGDEGEVVMLLNAMLEADLLALLVSNLGRLNEDDESDRSGVYHALSVIENISLRVATATRVSQDRSILDWLLQRLQRADSSVTQNRQYVAEILAILSQASADCRTQLIKLDVVDVLLQLVAAYRRRDPERGGEEEEYVENLFEAVTCLVDEAEGKDKFVEAEGVELCLFMLKEGKMSKAPALRLLEHASTSSSAFNVCCKIVESGGLKTTFSLFAKTRDHRLSSHLIVIFASMLRVLPGDSAERIRTLAKFVEKDYAKVGKLVELRRHYGLRVKQAEQQIAEERKLASEQDAPDREIEWLSRRLNAGLFTLQTIDVILAWLMVEDRGARSRIAELLAQEDLPLSVIKATLTEQMENLDNSQQDAQDLKDMLGTLVDFLR